MECISTHFYYAENIKIGSNKKKKEEQLVSNNNKNHLSFELTQKHTYVKLWLSKTTGFLVLKPLPLITSHLILS